MNDSNALFAHWFRKARTASGMSQQKVAEALRAQGHLVFHQTTIAKIERGERPVRLDEAVAITGLFGATVDAVLSPGSDEVIPDPVLQSLARRTSILGRIQALISAELSATPTTEEAS